MSIGLAHRAYERQVEYVGWLATPHGSRFGAAFLESRFGVGRALSPHMDDLERQARGIDQASQHFPVGDPTAVEIQQRARALLDETTAARAKLMASSRDFAKDIRLSLGAMPTYAVTRDAASLVTHASSRMAPQPLLDSDLPAPSGFVYLEDPWWIRDIRGASMCVRAMSWFHARTAIPEPYRSAPEVAAHLEDVTSDGILWMLYCDNDLDRWWEVGGIERSFLPVVSLAHMDLVKFGTSPHVDGIDLAERFEDLAVQPDPEIRAEARRDTSALAHWMQAFFAFVQQEVVTSSPTSPDRAMRRRAAREGRVIPGILVIQLRRRAQEHYLGDPLDAGAHVHWSHRWAVSGHWRQQWYPSLGVHRQIWIHPFVKGPAGLPFASKVKLNRVAR